MSILKSFVFTIILLCSLNHTFSQDTYHSNSSPKREFRGVWIATVANIDWPSKPGLSADFQKRELLRIFDEHQKSGINAILLQVRPAADAFYSQSTEPWSRFLSGKQGLAPSPFYDPLAFAIDEAHKRGMELHAWFNPYRASTTLSSTELSNQHISRTNPHWFFNYGGKKLFNPGLPEVRDYIVQTIMNVVKNYDIDGVHFDDYFYPYPEKGQVIRDAEEFSKYGTAFKNIGDWRRHNVDTLIKTLAENIHREKSYVKFGISPFGIWRNKSQDPAGSESNGLDGYGTLYADARKWIQNGWIDYINPQIYFPFKNRAAAFEKLTDWWSDNAFGKHVYIGQAAYRATERRQGWMNWSQIPDQIRYLRNNNRIQGSVYFSSKSLTGNYAGLQDSLRQNFYRNPSLPPQMLWRDDTPPQAPINLVALVSRNDKILLNWNEPLMSRDGEKAYGYVVYRFSNTETIDIQNPEKIVNISYHNKTTFVDSNNTPGTYLYVVTALDRMKNESMPSNNAIVSIPTPN